MKGLAKCYGFGQKLNEDCDKERGCHIEGNKEQRGTHGK